MACAQTCLRAFTFFSQYDELRRAQSSTLPESDDAAIGGLQNALWQSLRTQVRRRGSNPRNGRCGEFLRLIFPVAGSMLQYGLSVSANRTE